MKILITETWNPAGYAKRSHVRLRARSRTSHPLFLPARFPSGSITPESRDYAPLPRGMFSGTTPTAYGRLRRRRRSSYQFGCCRSFSSLREKQTRARFPSCFHTLDRAESRLSARLPRIMDATVTHVNEACHLHLLLRLPLSPRLPSPRISYPFLG